MAIEGPHSFRLSEDQVARAARLMARHQWRSGTMRLVLSGTVLACLALVALDAADGAVNVASTIAVLILLPLGLFALRASVSIQARRQYRQNSAMSAESRISFGDGQVILEGQRGTLTIPMAELHRYSLNLEFVLLHQSEGSANIVPLAALGGNSDRLVAQLDAAGVQRV